MSFRSSSQPNFIIYLNFILNGAKHSSYFRPYGANDGKSRPKLKYMVLGPKLQNWKINLISFGIPVFLPSRVNLYDVLKRKSSKTKSNQIRRNPVWDIFPPQKIDPGAPKMKISENFQNHQEWCKTSPEHENKLK